MGVYDYFGPYLIPGIAKAYKTYQKSQENQFPLPDSALPVYNAIYNFLNPNARQELQYGEPGFTPNPNSTDPIPLPSWLSNEQIENMGTSLLTASLMGMNQVDQVAMMANAQGESNFLPNRTLGGEDSVGLYQLNRQGGLGRKPWPNLNKFPVDVLQNPIFNTRRIADEYLNVIGNQSNVDDAIRRMVYYVERPLNKETDTIKRQGFARGYDHTGVVPTFGPTINVTAPRITEPSPTYVPRRPQYGPRLTNIDKTVRNNPNVSSAIEEKNETS